AYTLTRASLTITGATASQRYNGATQINGFRVISGQLFYADRIDSLTGLATGTNVGTYNDSLSAAAGVGLSNYDITYVNGGLTITRAPLTVASSTDPRTYSGLAQTNTFTVSGLFGGDTVSGVSGLATGTNAGTYAESLSGATGSGLGNYEITYISSGLTIAPAALTLTYTANTATSIYGQPLAAMSGSVGGAGFVNGETLGVLNGSATWTTAASAGASAGSYAITGGGLTSSNYAITALQAAINNLAYAVTRANLTIVGGAGARVYNGQTQTNSFSAIGLVGSDQIDGVTGLASGMNVGSYSDNLTGAFGAGLHNYNITYVNGSLRISPAALRVEGGVTTRTYSGAVQTNPFTVTGLMGNDTVTSVAGLASGVNAGAYADNLSGAMGSGLQNYTVAYTNGRLTIDPASLVLTYTASNAASTYGDPLAALSGTVAGSGFVGGETLAVLTGAPTWTTAAVVRSSVGGYAIIGGGLSASNYNVDVRQAPGNATAYAVTARPIAGVTGISVSDKRFDGTLTATADTRNASLSGLLPGDDVQLASVTAAFTSMGPGLAIPVTITLNGLTGAAARNYTLAPTTVTASAAITTQQIPTPAPLYTASLGVNVATPSPTNPSPPPPPPPNDPLAATPAETLAPAGNGGGSTDAKSVTCSQVGDQSVCKQDDPTGRIRADRP
ncbi:MAG: beta strand repeat-containing protein, partial [Phenylobacterium sp.]